MFSSGAGVAGIVEGTAKDIEAVGGGVDWVEGVVVVEQ